MVNRTSAVPFVVLAAALVAAPAASPAQTFPMTAEIGAAVLRSRELGASAPQSVLALRAAAAASPLNAGFLALGSAGKAGKVEGPPFGGNGTYRAIVNDAYQMEFAIKTGYIDGRFALKRDPATGTDQLGFAGRYKAGFGGGWTSVAAGPGGEIVCYPARIAYDAARDSGTIQWSLDGRQQNDAYHGGRGGSGSMTITLSGHKHVFTRD